MEDTMKRIVGHELTKDQKYELILRDDSGESRTFTVTCKGNIVLKDGIAMRFPDGTYFYAASGDDFHLSDRPMTDAEKLSVLIKGLQSEASNPQARRLLEEIGLR